MLEFISEVEPENSIEVDFGGRERSNSFVNILESNSSDSNFT